VEFLANENFPLASIRLLRIGSHKVESVVENFPGMKDHDVIYFRFSPSTPEEPANILLNIMEIRVATFSGKFTVVEREGMRQRKLPV
jgi:hypothetical protein